MRISSKISYCATLVALTVVSTAFAGDSKSLHANAFVCLGNCGSFNYSTTGVSNLSTVSSVPAWLPVLRDADGPMSFAIHWTPGRSTSSFCSIMFYLPDGRFGGSFATQPNSSATDELVRDAAFGGVVTINFDAATGLYCSMAKNVGQQQGMVRVRYTEG